MSSPSYATALAQLKDSIEASSRCPVITPLKSTHYVEKTNGTAVSTDSSKYTPTIVNLAQCIRKTSLDLINEIKLRGNHNYPCAVATFCIESYFFQLDFIDQIE